MSTRKGNRHSHSLSFKAGRLDERRKDGLAAAARNKCIGPSPAQG